MKQIIALMIGAAAAGVMAAEGVALEAAERGRWTFSAGPAWRARTKIKTSGSVSAPTATLPGGTSYDFDAGDPASWSTVPDPTTPGAELWAIRAQRTESVFTAGSGRSDLSSSEDDSALGLNAALGFDLLSEERFSLTLGLRVAAFFDMESSTGRFLNTGALTTRVTDGYFVCGNPPYPPSPSPTPPTPDRYDSDFRETGVIREETTYASGSRMVSSHFSADLYQLAFGPRVAWRVLPSVELYAGVEALASLAVMDFKANGASASDTTCLLGFGGHVGAAWAMTESLSLFGQAGYEWVDDTSLSAGGLRAEADFSSVVFTAGLQWRF